MNPLSAVLLTLLLSATAWAEPPAPEATYKQPYPHSSGAELLPYCEQTDVVVNQLRCDYYVQGVADLASIPRQGKPLACIPQGQTRTQLMQVVTMSLTAIRPEKLEMESAASLILDAFQKAFPCPKSVVAAPAIPKGDGAQDKQTATAANFCMLAAQQQVAGGAKSEAMVEFINNCMLEAKQRTAAGKAKE